MGEQLLRQLRNAFGEQRFSAGMIRKRPALAKLVERQAGQRLKFAFQMEAIINALDGQAFEVDGITLSLHSSTTRYTTWWWFQPSEPS